MLMTYVYFRQMKSEIDYKSCQLQSFKIHKSAMYYNLHIFGDIWFISYDS